MNVKFYLNSADKRKADKTKYLSNETLANVKLKENTDEMNPIFILSADKVDFNYFYVPSWNKYYFISKPPKFLNGGMIEIEGHIDILFSVWEYDKTNKKGLKYKNALIERSETNYSAYIIDPKQLMETKRNITHLVVGNVGNAEGSYIALTVSGGV